MSTDQAALETVVITGAAGRIGRSIVPLLRRPGRMLRLLDLEVPDTPPDDGVTWHRVSVEDPDGLTAAMRGATAVVHLAALASERPWPDILRVNIDGTQHVLEAALALDDGRHHVVWGVSENAPHWLPLDAGHEIGYHPVDDAVAFRTGRDGVAPPWPDAGVLLGGSFTDATHPVGGTW